MGRMYSRGKGFSASALLCKGISPSWVTRPPQDVGEPICKFAKKGWTPSHIGVILRDSHGIVQVKSVTGSKILRILKAHGSKFRLILVESRIHRLARYYKKTKKLPPVWK
ncbi:unnamed protein product [Arabidopsis arenosa]|uniref:Small ribosomal subunit protein uS15 N-terminal domain-containing protein n=1 Tax=Arabidopsis arenosa TaxID=38785 RepID=A0A8S1ZYP1_ARAAE|nr:unnamed protein product [Arabidopsis arenosa]